MKSRRSGPRARRSVRGMTLVEVLISSLVLGCGVVALAELFTTSFRTDLDARSRDVATQLAIQRAEQLGTLPPDRLPACGGGLSSCRVATRAYAPVRAAAPTFACTQIVDDGLIPDDTTTLEVGKYRIDTAVDVPPGSGQQSDARVLSVSVCWTNAKGLVQQVQVERLVVPEV